MSYSWVAQYEEEEKYHLNKLNDVLKIYFKTELSFDKKYIYIIINDIKLFFIRYNIGNDFYEIYDKNYDYKSMKIIKSSINKKYDEILSYIKNTNEYKILIRERKLKKILK